MNLLFSVWSLASTHNSHTSSLSLSRSLTPSRNSQRRDTRRLTLNSRENSRENSSFHVSTNFRSLGLGGAWCRKFRCAFFVRLSFLPTPNLLCLFFFGRFFVLFFFWLALPFLRKSRHLRKMEKEPFRIHDKCNGMYRVTVVDTGEYTVRDLKLALEATHGVPLAESVLIADGGAMPDEARLSDFVVGTSWVVMIHRPLVVEAEAAAEQQEASHGAAGPEEAVANNGNDAGDGGVEVIPHRAQSAPVTPGGTLKATFSFFYRGDVKNLSIKSADSIGSVLENVVAPAFGVESPERLGLYVECCLLPRDSLVEDSLQLLRSCAIIPVVNDLVTMRVRNQNMPADAFRTDCDVCMTTGVNSKLRCVCLASSLLFYWIFSPCHKNNNASFFESLAH